VKLLPNIHIKIPMTIDTKLVKHKVKWSNTHQFTRAVQYCTETSIWLYLLARPYICTMSRYRHKNWR